MHTPTCLLVIYHRGETWARVPFDKSLISVMQMQLCGPYILKGHYLLGCLSHRDLKNHLRTQPKRNCGHPFAFLGNSNFHCQCMPLGLYTKYEFLVKGMFFKSWSICASFIWFFVFFPQLFFKLLNMLLLLFICFQLGFLFVVLVFNFFF